MVGPAGHVVHYYLPQGAAQPLEDACELAAHIAGTPGDMTGALRRYEAHRIPRTLRVQLGARARGKANHLPSIGARFLRDARLTLRRWLAPDAPLHQAEWIYSYDAGRLD